MLFITAVLGAAISAHGSYFDQYLSDVLQSQRDYCTKVVRQNSPEKEISCLTKINRFIQSVDSCDKDRERFDEALILEKYQFSQEVEEIVDAVPNEVLNLFNKMTTAATLAFNTRNKINWKLSTFESQTQNGFAGVSGHIILSSNLWRGSQKLQTQELAAIMAHEISHVIKNHRLKLACHAYAWEMDGTKNLLTAMQDFKTELRSGYPRAFAWEKINHEFEFEADEDAILILKSAGFNPLALSKALEKINTHIIDPFNPSSHPSMDQRIKKAKNLALKI